MLSLFLLFWMIVSFAVVSTECEQYFDMKVLCYDVKCNVFRGKARKSPRTFLAEPVVIQCCKGSVVVGAIAEYPAHVFFSTNLLLPWSRSD